VKLELLLGMHMSYAKEARILGIDVKLFATAACTSTSLMKNMRTMRASNLAFSAAEYEHNSDT
jgi:hypothetical protein